MSSFYQRFLPAEQMMIRLAFLVLGVIAMAASGCCGPAGCGIGCSTGCGGCGAPSVSGCGCGAGACRGGACGRGGPLMALRNARKRLICGSGCGEAYIGEWISTPPDCSDPCCNDQFIGGAVKARPFCRQSRRVLFPNLYGRRNCTGNQSTASCGCGEVVCDACSGGDYVVSEFDAGGYSEVVSGVQEGGCGCSTCRTSSPMASRLANARGRVAGRSITSRAKYNQITERAEQIRR